MKNRPPVVLVAGGLDPTGSAGLLADARVLHSLGCHPCGIVTCETVQSSKGVSAVYPASPGLFREQLAALIDDIKIDAIKIGALASPEIIMVLGNELEKLPGVPIVLDPVFKSTSGTVFLDQAGMGPLAQYILPKTLIATPNVYELGAPAEIDIDPTEDRMILGCATGWLSTGVKSLLVTGLPHGDGIEDRYIEPAWSGKVRVKSFTHPYYNVGEVHGTGCVLSSAIAGFIAQREDVLKAVEKASEYASNLIANAARFGKGSAFWVE
ncbi:MAG: hydroxymethylpyrimidine/phosphomethylpyrimidine kinase [bacterium]|nr:hydroxymethylpyrimidine/phosphomethylpyrimidine kinase [bacterium]